MPYKEEVTSIKEGMKRLILDMQKEALDKLSSQMDTIIKEKEKTIRSELAAVLDEVRKNRENLEAFTQAKGLAGKAQLESIMNEVKKNREGISKIPKIKKELDELFSKKIEEARRAVESVREKTERDIGEIKKLSELVSHFRGDVKTLDIKSILASLETLRVKVQGLESRLDGLQNLYTRIERLEADIAALRSGMPAVIE